MFSHLGAWSLTIITIYLKGIQKDLHEDKSLHQLNQGYCSSYGTFYYIKSLHVQQHLFYYSNSTIRSSNMIITYDSINIIMIMQPILQVAIQSPCFLKQLFQQGWNLISSWPSPSNFFKIDYNLAVLANYSYTVISNYILDCSNSKLIIQTFSSNNFNALDSLNQEWYPL